MIAAARSALLRTDDVIDAVRQEATEEAQRTAAVAPLEDGYMQTSLIELWWKRGVWLTVLFVTAMFTATALHHYEDQLSKWKWLVIFIPLIMGSGGNTGNQSATLIITALTTGNVRLRDWRIIFWRTSGWLNAWRSLGLPRPDSLLDPNPQRSRGANATPSGRS